MTSTAEIEKHYGVAFEDTVIHNYQQKLRRLRGTTRQKMVKDAKDLTFRKAGKGTASTRTRGGAITLMNAGRSNVTVTPEERHGAEFIDRKDMLRLAYDDRDVSAYYIAAALARAADDDIIQVASAATANAVLDWSSSKVQLEMALHAEGVLSDQDVPDDGMLTWVVTPKIFNELLTFEQFSNSDYIGMDDLPFTTKRLTRMMAKFWNGMRVVKHTGLNVTSGVADTIMYHETSIGHGSLDEISTEVDKTNATGVPGYNVVGYMDMGAVAIQPEGIQVIKISDAMTVPAFG